VLSDDVGWRGFRIRVILNMDEQGSRTIEQVRGMIEEMGWGFRTLLGETPVLNFFSTDSLMNETFKISLKSFPIKMA
jgi:hypothetical protein